MGSMGWCWNWFYFSATFNIQIYAMLRNICISLRWQLYTIDIDITLLGFNHMSQNVVKIIRLPDDLYRCIQTCCNMPCLFNLIKLKSWTEWTAGEHNQSGNMA